MKFLQYILFYTKSKNFLTHNGIQSLSKNNFHCMSASQFLEKIKRVSSPQQLYSVLEISRRNADTKNYSAIQQNNDKDKKKPIKISEVKRLLALAKPEMATLAGAFTLLALSSSITMAVPFALGKVIDIIYTADVDTMKDNLNTVCLWLSGVFLVGGFSNFGRVYLINTAGQRITKSLRSSVFKSIIHQETAFFDQAKTGELVNRLSADTSLVSHSLTNNISDGFRSIIMVVAGVGMMFYMSQKLAIVGLSVVPPVVVMAIFYGKYLRVISKNVQDKLATATHVAEERISNIRTVKAFAQEVKEISEYNLSITDVLKLTYKEALAKGIFFGITGLSGNIIVLSVLYYGGNLVTESDLSVGNLSSFLLYAAYVSIALNGVSSFYSEMNRGLGASTRLFQLIDRQPLIPNDIGICLNSNEVAGEILFKNVCFSYPSRPDDNILQNFDLAVHSGSVVALVGASGSGKSTVGSLLLRLYDVQAGEIFMDNLPIRSLNPTWLRSMIGYVAQEPILFSTTILQNIKYGSQLDNVSLEKVKWAAKEANALEFIEAFPDSFDTIVGERGIMLSGGQRQRVAIARALISDPKILLLDEATSALDAESESLVQEALERLMEGRTVITIAHRLSTIRNANSIAVLKNGQVAEIGSYDVLYNKQNGLFRKLIEKQTITAR